MTQQTGAERSRVIAERFTTGERESTRDAGSTLKRETVSDAIISARTINGGWEVVVAGGRGLEEYRITHELRRLSEAVLE